MNPSNVQEEQDNVIQPNDPPIHREEPMNPIQPIDPIPDRYPDNLPDPIDSTDSTLDKEYDCFCCGKQIINTSPKILATFFISVLVLVLAFVYMFVKGDVVIFAPIVTAVVAFWVPSPLQVNQPRKDALQNTRLLNNHLQMNRYMMARRYQNV